MYLGELTPHEIGDRLRIARKAAGLTQADVASSIDVARTTLLAIEKGHRRIRPVELQRVARLYGVSANEVLRHESVFVDILPQFRSLRTSNEEVTESAVSLLADLVQAEVELEDILGIKRTRNYPPERLIMPGDVSTQAENDATELRRWLGLGLAPIRDPVSLLELDLGVRVYIRRFDAKVSGLFAYGNEVGACILLNANHPRERRAQSAVHELGHLVSTRHKAEILPAGGEGNSREERYASVFGRAFLTPARTVMQRFHEILAGASSLTRRHVILLAYTFGVSREAMVRRLEELRLTKQGTWDWFLDNGGITNAQTRQVLGDLVGVDIEKDESNRPTTLRLNLLAAEAWRQNLLSEGQLARLLHLERLELREILDNVEIEGDEADGMPNLLE